MKLTTKIKEHNMARDMEVQLYHSAKTEATCSVHNSLLLESDIGTELESHACHMTRALLHVHVAEVN